MKAITTRGPAQAATRNGNTGDRQQGAEITGARLAAATRPDPEVVEKLRGGGMETRLLISGAGSGASNNLIRSLRAGDPALVIVGYHDDRFALKNSPADRNYLVPSSTRPDFAAALRRVLEIEGIDLLIPNSDPDVRAISRLRARIRCRLFLPRRSEERRVGKECRL